MILVNAGFKKGDEVSLLVRLINGELIYSEGGNEIRFSVKFMDSGLNPFVVDVLGTTEPLDFSVHDIKKMQIEQKWYDSIPAGGISCKVWQDDINYFDIDVISDIKKGLFVGRRYAWKNAIPIPLSCVDIIKNL